MLSDIVICGFVSQLIYVHQAASSDSSNTQHFSFMMEPLTIAEDCAGLGTGTITLQRMAERLAKRNRHNASEMVKSQQKSVSQFASLRGGTKKVRRPKIQPLKVKPVYFSEAEEPLRKFLKSRYAKAKIVEDAETGLSDKGNTLLGLDGQLDIYISGGCCQPFSKMGLNNGQGDSRSDTTKTSVSFIAKRRPKLFILENVKNMLSKTHKQFFKETIVNRLRAITKYSRRHNRHVGLYRFHMRIYNSRDFGSPQRRERVIIVGVRKDATKFRRFTMPGPQLRRPKRILELLQPARQESRISDGGLNYTEDRNWRKIQEEIATINATGGNQVRFPIIADLQMSAKFGTSWQSCSCPTITRTRARSRGFWLINRGPNGMNKRRLGVADYAALQGWDNGTMKNYLKIHSLSRQLSDAQLLAALGNGFSVSVFEAIFQNLLTSMGD